MVKVILLLILAALAVHVLLNIVFCIIYCTKIRADVGFTHWRAAHHCSIALVPSLATVVSFHFFRIFYSGFCNLKGCQASFTDIAVLLRPLVRCTYVSIFCTHFPLIAAQVLTLLHFDYHDRIWFVALDSLFVTVIVSIILFIDLRRSENQIILGDKGFSQVSDISELSSFDSGGIDKSLNYTAKKPLLRKLIRRHFRRGISKSLERLPQIDIDPVLASSKAASKLKRRSLSFSVNEDRSPLPQPAIKRLLNTPNGKRPFNPDERNYAGSRGELRELLSSREEAWEIVVPKTKQVVEPVPDVLESVPVKRTEMLTDGSLIDEPQAEEIIVNRQLLDKEAWGAPQEEEEAGVIDVAKIEKKKKDTRKMKLYFTPFKLSENEQETGFIDLPTESRVQQSRPQTASSQWLESPAEEEQTSQQSSPSPQPRAKTPQSIEVEDKPPSRSDIESKPTPQPTPQPKPQPQLQPKPQPQAKPPSSSEVKADPMKWAEPVVAAPQAHEEVKEHIVPEEAPDTAEAQFSELGESSDRAVTAELQLDESPLVTLESQDLKQKSANELPLDRYKYNDAGSVFDIDEPVIPKAKIKENYLGTIEEEAEFDFERAIKDSDDPEVVTVPNLESGERFRLKKDFHGARIVDLENKVVESIPPIETSRYELPLTIVDEEDVHYATLTTHSGESVRVKRDFKGARIIDLEKRTSHPQAYLIGQSVQREEDFQFHNAVPDPDDPEVVVVMHNETGVDVRVRKNFNGARLVDPQGNVLQDKPPINRNDYDINSTEVEPEDVHLATLKHKTTAMRVRVRRDFRGAKIIELEKKSTGAAMRSLYHDKSEPESPEFSQISLSQDDSWRAPLRVNKPPRPVRPIDISDMFPDEAHDRSHLTELQSIITELAQKETAQPEPANWPENGSFSGLEDEDSLPLGRKIYRRPIYRNLDLDSVYGSGMMHSNSHISSKSSFTQASGRKKRSLFPDDPVKASSINKIYLQRLGAQPNSTRAQGPPPLHSDLLSEIANEYAEESSPSRVRDSYLAAAGEEIASGRNPRRFSRPQ
jgi:hypothetical protein